MNDLAIYFQDEHIQWKKDCFKICNAIEYSVASFYGRKQLKLIREFKDGRFTRDVFEHRIKNIAKAMNLLGEASQRQRRIFSER